jgi:hypothetical protein
MQRVRLFQKIAMTLCVVSFTVSCQEQNRSNKQPVELADVGISHSRESLASDSADGVPTEADWRSEPWVLDGGEEIYEAFAGKSREDAREVFATRPWAAQSYLQDMPTVCFRFYVRSFLDYLQSTDARGDASAACNFTPIAESMAGGLLPMDDLAQPAVVEVLEKIVATPEWYGLQGSDYESIIEQAMKILRQVNTRTEGPIDGKRH